MMYHPNAVPNYYAEMAGKRAKPVRQPMHMQTMSGRMFDLNNPVAEQVLIEDIGAHLARLCRFTGGLQDPDAFYPVSEHLCLGAGRAWRDGGYELARYWFAHDFGEAYTGDISRPMKELLGYERVKEIEDRVDAAVAEAFGLRWTPEIHEAVKVIDNRMLNTERRDLLAPADGWQRRWIAEPYEEITVRSISIPAARARFFKYARNLGFMEV